MKSSKLVLLFLFFIVNYANAQDKIYLARIEDEIDLGLSPYVARVISEAEKNGADAIIFKINTFGGRVDAATQIKDAILNSKVKTIAFINNRAISAGALIALSCNQIVMVPGSSIGAATVVDQSGEKVSEKYQSYMRSEMRSTAEKNGRNTLIAEGMVDERIVVEGLVDSTKLITLTSTEALKYKIADHVVENIDELYSVYNFRKTQTIDITSNWAEDVVRFLNNPIISSILIMIGFFGLFAEVKTPGWGVPGTAGLIALALFFGSSYILELASIVEILLFVIGLILIAVEIFVIPGFGFAGISGIVLVVLSLFLSLIGGMPYFDFSFISVAIIQLTVALLAALLLIFILAKYLPKSKTFHRLVLDEEESSTRGFVTYPNLDELLGKDGVALTTLRPAGTAEISDKRVDVVTDGQYVEKGAKIKVIKVEGVKVVVKEI
ncbi:MAG: nodulation protein NfeD [Ignavibacteriales bacterium]|nr:MAG: nodulation protein NfeD [Ignavibacteriales bacterium]